MLDLNRGVITKFHPSGIKVNMYLDDPGTYLDDKGEQIDSKFAEQAGFNVERDRREKRKQLMLDQYKERLEREMKTEEEAIADAMSQSGKYDVRPIGGGQYALFDKDGVRVTRAPMSKADIEMLLGPLPDLPDASEAATVAPPSREDALRQLGQRAAVTPVAPDATAASATAQGEELPKPIALGASSDTPEDE